MQRDGLGPRQATPNVLILDEGFISGAQAAVGLRNAGCRVSVLAATGGHGRCVARDITWSLAPPSATDAFLEAVDDAVHRDEIDVVYPVTEPLQRRLWDAVLRRHDLVYPELQTWQQELLQDKHRLSRFLENSGVPVPEGSDVPVTDVSESIEALGTPIVVRGVRGRGGSATRIVNTRESAERAIQQLSRRGTPCFLQRYIDGGTFLAGGVFDRGVPVRFYSGFKRVQYPERTGPAAVIESLHDQKLSDVARRAFALTRINGIASADFVRDRSGRYLFLELNPRPWGSMAAAAECGVDLFSPMVDLLSGRTPDTDLAFRGGVVSNVLPLYLLSARCWLDGTVIRSFMRDLRGPQGAPWRGGGAQVVHLLHRLYRAGRTWRAA